MVPRVHASPLHGMRKAVTAIVRGYDATLVADAHTTEDLTEWGAPPPTQVIDHTNLYWGNHPHPGGRPARSRPPPSSSAEFGQPFQIQ